MNCLLVVPPLNVELLRSFSFPLGLGYISAAMKGLALEGVKTFNLNLHHERGDSVQAVLEAVGREKIEAVLIGGVNFDHGPIKRIIKAVKEYDPHIQVLVGGGIITNDPETAMRALPWADFGLIGEGDLSVPELCLALKNGRDPETVNGLIFKKDGDLIRTPPRAELMDLASLPWCDYEGLGFEKYLSGGRPIGRLGIELEMPLRTLPLVTSRSCPYHCTFCAHLPGSTYRERDLDDIFKEIDSLVDQYQIEYLYVLDDLLARSLARLSEFCARVEKYKLKGWRAQFRVDHLTVEKLAIIKKSGCKTVCLGLESASNAVLKSMRKQLTIEQIEAGLSLIREAGLKELGGFIFGDVAETYETSLETFNWLDKHPQYDHISVTPLRVYPGSEIYRFALKTGLIQDPVKFLDEGCPQVNISRMSAEEFEIIMNRVNAYIPARTLAYPPLKSFKTLAVDYDRELVTFEGLCPFCQGTTTYEEADMYRNNHIACHHCEARLQPPPIKDLAPNVAGNLARILKRHRQIGFWGLGWDFRHIIRAEDVADPRIHLIDINCRQMPDYGHKKVEHPDIIKELGLSLIITVSKESRHYDHIVATAADKYNLRCVLDLYSLQKTNLTIPI